MHYLIFLILLFVLPLVGLVVLQRAILRAASGVRLIMRISIISGLLLLYLIPFLSAMTEARVWYYDPALTLGVRFGTVPIEEYVVYVLLAVNGSLVTLWLWRRFYRNDFR